MAEYINKWTVVDKLIALENEFQHHKPFHGFEHAMYRKICELEMEIGKTPGIEAEIETLQALSLKWISVKDRLPENNQWALCFMKDKSFGTFRVFQWNYVDWQWNDGNEWFDEKDVTHWMPLPKPPKGE